MAEFCSICTATAIDAGDLQPGEDGKLECRRCRTEHPRAGGYAFNVRSNRGRARGKSKHVEGTS